MSALFKPELFVRMILIISVFVLSDCATKQTATVSKISSEKTGWIDDETFRIKGKGSPTPEITVEKKKKEKAI